MKLGNLATPSLHLPRPSVKAPAIMKASVYKAKTSAGGWAAKVVHHMTDGTKQQFNFTDPMTFGKHLTKITRAQWRHPQKNEGAAIAHSLDMG